MPKRKVMICAFVFCAIILLGAKLNHDVLEREAAAYNRFSPYPTYKINVSPDSDMEFDGYTTYSPREYVKIISLQAP